MDDVSAALAAETRRLRSEVKQLEARLRAIEAGRWYRLNPRRAWQRLRPRPTAALEQRAEAPQQETQTFSMPAVADTATPEDFHNAVIAPGRFTHFWALEDAAKWEPIFQAISDEPAPRVLEIGCFEGLWTCYVLWRLRRARVTCVDTFQGGLDHSGTNTVPDDLERIFDENVALVDATRVRKLVGESRKRLGDIAGETARFELVYIDGSHLGLDVLVDAALSWQLLTPRGFLVFDDYEWAALGEDPLLRPGPAIDAFLTLVEGSYDLVFADYKLGVRKRD